MLKVLKETKGVIGEPHGAAVPLGFKRTTLLSKQSGRTARPLCSRALGFLDLPPASPRRLVRRRAGLDRTVALSGASVSQSSCEFGIRSASSKQSDSELICSKTTLVLIELNLKEDCSFHEG